MPLDELPHTAGCVVCGPKNPHGLHLSLHVDRQTGVVSSKFMPGPEHIGFEGIIHGGVLATVLDEAMVWAATWSGRKFCVCGELAVRYRRSAAVGTHLFVEARVETVRSRLIETVGALTTEDGAVIATATGKYVPVPRDRHADVVATLLPSPGVEPTLKELAAGSEALK